MEAEFTIEKTKQKLEKLLEYLHQEYPDNDVIAYTFQNGDLEVLKDPSIFVRLAESNYAKLEKYARHLSKRYVEYHKYQFEGKNGANSENEKGYWRGMADSVLAILNDWKKAGLIDHLGLYGDLWPEETLSKEEILDNNTMLSINGENFVCEGGSNVFTKLRRNNKIVYRCHCGLKHEHTVE